jgi:hypothetical protein
MKKFLCIFLIMLSLVSITNARPRQTPNRNAMPEQPPSLPEILVFSYFAPIPCVIIGDALKYIRSICSKVLTPTKEELV